MRSISAPSWLLWKHSSFAPAFAAKRCQFCVDLVQRGAAIDLRLTRAEQVQVGAVQNEDAHGGCQGPGAAGRTLRGGRTLRSLYAVVSDWPSTKKAISRGHLHACSGLTASRSAAQREFVEARLPALAVRTRPAVEHHRERQARRCLPSRGSGRCRSKPASPMESHRLRARNWRTGSARRRQAHHLQAAAPEFALQRSNSGSSLTQGGHQVAQKFSTSGRPRSDAIASSPPSGGRSAVARSRVAPTVARRAATTRPSRCRRRAARHRRPTEQVRAVMRRLRHAGAAARPGRRASCGRGRRA
jgi:hypothetical protein